MWKVLQNFYHINCSYEHHNKTEDAVTGHSVSLRKDGKVYLDTKGGSCTLESLQLSFFFAPVEAGAKGSFWAVDGKYKLISFPQISTK